MDKIYEQNLKNFADTFRNLNIQLLGFILVAIGFLLASDVLMVDPALYMVAGGMFFTIEFWILSLIAFFSIKSYLLETNPDYQVIYKTLNDGKRMFGWGLLSLSFGLTYFVAYIAFFFQLGLSKYYAVFISLILAGSAIYQIWGEYQGRIKIIQPPANLSDNQDKLL